MNDQQPPSKPAAAADIPGAFGDAEQERTRLRKRRRKEVRFKAYAIGALLITAGFLVFFIVDLCIKGLPALRQAEIKTEITLTPQTVRDIDQAFPEEVRDLVSRAAKREIRRQAQLAEIRLPVDLDADSAEAAIRPLRITADDMPPWIRDFEPVTIPPEHVAAFLGEAGMADLRSKLEEGPPPDDDGDSKIWIRGSAALQQFMTDSTGLGEELAESVRLLEKVDHVRAGFNYRRYGEKGSVVEEWVLADSSVDQYVKGYAYTRLDPVERPEELSETDRERRATIEARNERIERLAAAGRIELKFNSNFFLRGDSKIPEIAGIKAAVVGSVYVLALVFFICLPIGVLTSIYLEEFAPDNALTRAIEVNINNLAAIPSILFGVLGLAAFINFFGMPRNSVLVGGVTLALMTLPVVIISTRAALRAVPDTVRNAGFAMGATRWQVVLHHVLPSSISGIMTGSIIGLAQAMGETAPLIMIGLVSFIPEPPTLPTDPTTVMPAQIYTWFSESMRAFQERAALGILMLLLVLFVMNGFAVWIRARAERKW